MTWYIDAYNTRLESLLHICCYHSHCFLVILKEIKQKIFLLAPKGIVDPKLCACYSYGHVTLGFVIGMDISCALKNKWEEFV